jgi:hypothetical protein
MKRIAFLFFILLLAALPHAWAGIEGSISGTLTDADQAGVEGATVELLSTGGAVVKEVKSSPTGEFQIFPVNFGSYLVVVKAKGYAEVKTTAQVASSAPAVLDLRLLKSSEGQELVINVKEKRNLVPKSASGSQTDLTAQQIATLPQGEDISLPKLLAETTPGIVQGAFGQMFIRGNHANIQYQIDGVQLPDSTSGTFGDAFSPRNIDHMEIITGGVPAEYGERLAAVMNIITKSGPEKAGGEAEVSYGSYNTISPQENFGGSDSSGRIHYLGSFNYRQSDRGLDTPEPVSEGNQKKGGTLAIHDKSQSNDEFLRFDDILDNDNKFTITAFNSTRAFQIPVYPSSFKPTDAFFQAGYTDQFGNQAADPTQTTYTYVPPSTDDNQKEQNSYVEFVWKRTLSEHAFLQVAPYYKYSALKVTNDPVHDLATAVGGATPVTGSQASSFAVDRYTNNIGLKSDVTWRRDDKNLWKAGFQAQDSMSKTRNLSIQTSLSSAAQNFSGDDTGYLEAAYLQDSYSLSPKWTFNLGLRLTTTQFQSSGVTTNDGSVQPRLEVEYLVLEKTKLHAFYGKLFQPAPFEDLREAFSTSNGGKLGSYDVKAEKDDYYEIGVSQQIGERHVASVNYYYKHATDMLDETQVPNTSVAQPYNFAKGYSTGVELSLSGEIVHHLNDFFNYSYEDARGEGVGGGFFAFTPGTLPPNSYQFLDHVQLNTANAGLTYSRDSYWSSLEALFGSGLRTGPNNSLSLPSHLTFDWTIGYKLTGPSWYSGLKASFDLLNLTDQAYPVTIANGYSGSHYAAGREYFVHLGDEF